MIRQLALEAVKNPMQFKLMETQNPRLHAQIMAEINKLGGGAAGLGLDLSQWGEPQKAGGR
jgi:tartrate dehydratase alpha subunit/fumarate hydratase class I-like protein